MAESTVRVVFLGDSSKLKSSLGDIDDAAGKAESGFGKVAKAAAGMFAGAAVIGGFKSVIGSATDLAETQSKVGVLFGDSADEIEKFAESAAKNLGQTKQQAMDAAATFATFGKAAGLDSSELGKFSTEFTALASDLASFNNTSPEEAIEAIGSALRGEAEPMRKYGVLLDDMAMRQEAVRLGFIETTATALTPQIKVMAAQALIYKQTGAAQGDFARTSDGLANRQRILAAQFENAKTQLGQAFLPAALAVSQVLLDKVVPAFQELIGGVSAFVNAFRDGGDEITSSGFAGFLERLGVASRNVFDWLRENVPPVLERIRAAAEVAFGWLRDNVPPAIEAVRRAIEATVGAIEAWWRTHWQDIRAVVESVFGTIRRIVETTLAAIEAFWRTWGGTITRYVQGLFDAIMQVIQGALDVIRGVMDVVMGLIRGDWGRVWDGIKQIVDGVWQAINGLIDQAINTIRTVIETGMRLVAGVFDAAWDAVWDATNAGLQSVVSYISTLPDRILSALGDLGRLLYDIGKAILQGLWDGMKDMWGAVSGWVGGLGDKIKGLKGPIQADRVLLVDEGYAIMEGLENGMRAKWIDIEQTLGGVGYEIVETFAEANGMVLDQTESWGDTLARIYERTADSVGVASDSIIGAASRASGAIDSLRDVASRFDPYTAFAVGSAADKANQEIFEREKAANPGKVYNPETGKWESPVFTPASSTPWMSDGGVLPGSSATPITVNVNVSGGLGSPESIGNAAAQTVSRELAVLLRGAVG